MQSLVQTHVALHNSHHEHITKLVETIHVRNFPKILAKQWMILLPQLSQWNAFSIHFLQRHQCRMTTKILVPTLLLLIMVVKREQKRHTSPIPNTGQNQDKAFFQKPSNTSVNTEPSSTISAREILSKPKPRISS